MIIVSDKTRTAVSVKEEDCRPARSTRTLQTNRESKMNHPSSGKSKKDATKEPRVVRKVTVIRKKKEDGSRGADEKTGEPGGEDVKRFKGDGLSLKMDSNNRVLVVTGDGCNVTLARNSGKIRVVGDGCRLKVDHNVGYIEYEGDGGRVLLGPRSLKERVKYVGDGGLISFNDGARKFPKKQQGSGDATEKPKKSPSKESKCNVKREQDTQRSVKKTVTTTTTTRVTTVQNGMKSVEKWFVDPTAVIRSFAGLNLKLQ